jgi:NAD(P)-dependent dehydrogenase (short-subunit alcohol dehydrogenase family)
MPTAKDFGSLSGKNCIVTGGGGIIGQSLSEGLAAAGVHVAVLDLVKDAADALAASLVKNHAIHAIGVEANVLDKSSLVRAKGEINGRLGPIHYLINCAGGNSPRATTKEEFVGRETAGDLGGTFYGLDIEGFRKVFDLNFLGTILPTMVFTTDMIAAGEGAILNISSMNSFRPLTKIPAYSAAKASVNNFTEWLAVHLAKVNVRVNGIAPGFLSTQQNKFLLFDEKTGEPTERARKILAGTPMGRFGQPDELQGAVLFLLSDLARFITGVVLPIDGGFNAYSGV